jgi:AhpC/TSA family protein
MKPFFVLFTLPFLAAFQDAPPKSDFDAELKALRAEYQKAYQEYYRPYREAKTDEERKKIKLDPANNPDLTFMLKYKEFAERANGTEAGAGALLEVVNLGPRVKKVGDAKASLAILTDTYIASPSMERLATSLRYAGYSLGDDRVREALETIRAKSPHAKAKAAATFVLAVQGMEKDQNASRALFAELKKDYGDTSHAAKADAFLFELDNLQIGMKAPDFEATDEKGAKYKLSDYRGKITVIDFWGFW